MNQKSLLKIFIMISIFLLANQHQTTQQIFKPSWLNYQKGPDTNFIISNPNHKYSIHFNIASNKVKTEEISINSQNIWTSRYRTEQNHSIMVYGKGSEGLIQIQSAQNKQVSFIIKKQNTEKLNIFVSQECSVKQFQPIEKVCRVLENKDQNIQCNLIIGSNNKLFILFSETEDLSNLLTLFNNTQIYTFNQRALEQFIKIQKIQQIENFTTQFVKDMLTFTLSSLCTQSSEYEGYQFYGLCSNDKFDQIQKHYSLLVLEILFSYNLELAMWLVENYLNLLQEKLFYSFRSDEWIPIPENTQVFKVYLKYLDNSNMNVNEIQKRKNLVIQVQNGLINNLLLSEVNHLSEEINYRESNKIHPTIMKMLTQAWKTDSVRAKVSSIYSESFTNDFYYHSKNEKLDSSVGKMAWLLKIIYEHIDVIEKYGDVIQKQSLEQLLSLSRVVSGFMLDQPRAKEGIFNSIIIQEKIKVYSRSLGYESLLPYVYEITQTFPMLAIYNLTTEVGIASLPLNHDKVNQNYDYRGNIQLYFNYKVLFSILHKNFGSKKNKMFVEGAISVIESVQKMIKEVYLNGQKDKGFWTAWTAEGKGKKSQKYLAILNTVFMENLSQIKKTLTSQIRPQKS